MNRIQRSELELPEQEQVSALERLNLLVQKLSTGSNVAERGQRFSWRNWLKQRIGRALEVIPSSQYEQIAIAVTQSLNDLAGKTSLREFETAEIVQRHSENLNRQIGENSTRIERRLAELQSGLDVLTQRLEQMDGVCRGLESIVAQRPRQVSEVSVTESSVGTSIDYSYLLLENRFRGSEQEVKERLRSYVSLFTKVVGPICEIGAGRGELQELFIEAEVKSFGVELDQGMVEVCQAKQLPVRLADGLEVLREAEPRSLGGIIAIQVIEHLPLPVLEEFLRLASDKVEVNGVIVLETINTSSMVALTKNYFRDPTHAQPLHPDTMRYLAELNGLQVREVQFRSAYPDAVVFPSVETSVTDTTAIRSLIESYNQTTKSLNELLFGYQDYALIASPHVQ